LAAPLCAQDPDTQLWPELQVNVAVHPKVTFNAGGAFRAGDDVSRFIQGRFLTGVSFAPSRYLSLSPSYNYISNHRVAAPRQVEHRLLFDATLRAPAWRGFVFSDRNRLEARHVASDWRCRYRNRLQLELGLRAGNHRVAPYGAAELFYDRRLHSWHRVRYFAGAKLGINEHLTVDPYYVYQADGHNSIPRVHAMGITLGLRFRAYR
jgi:hypothetical protein